MNKIAVMIIKFIELGILIYFTIRFVMKCKETKVSIVQAIGINKFKLKDFISGLTIGFIAMLGIFLTEKFLGYLSVYGVKPISNSFVAIILKLIIGAAYEELIFRGFLLNGVMISFNKKYVAIVLSAILFGLAHAGNPHATIISVISNSLGGVMYAIAFLEGGIWLSFSLHFAWNFFQGPILGFPVSGFNMGGIISQSASYGHEFLNGGYYGPEGGIIGISFRVIVIIMVLLYCNRRNRLE